MRTFAALLFAAYVYANDATEEESSSWDDVKSWWSSKQEPVEFDSIITKEPCGLKGAYGWFGKVGTSNVFIRETVHGCEIADGSIVLTWAQLANPDMAGESEGFYCTVDYTKGAESTGVTDVYVKTLTGKVDFAGLGAVTPGDWCKEVDAETDTCMRQSLDSWNRMLTNADVNYPIDNMDDDLSAASCSAWRKDESPNNYMEIKMGTEYDVKTGYMIYVNQAAYDNGNAVSSGSGIMVGMTFENAATLAVGAAMLIHSALAI